MKFVDSLVEVPLQRRFAFSPNGGQVARLTERDGALAVEVRELAGRPSAQQVIVPGRALSDDALLYFPCEGRLLIRCRLDRGFQVLEARRLTGNPAAWTARTVATLDVPGMSLLPPIPGAPWDALVALTEDLVSTIWRLDREGPPAWAGGKTHGTPRLQPLARIPGIISSGDWVEPGRVLAVNLRGAGGTSGFLVDLEAGTCQRLFHLSDASNDHVALVDRRRGLLAVTSDCFGHGRAGVAQLRGERRVRFFPDPSGEDRTVDVCALAPDGNHLVLRRQRGVRSDLWLADPDRLTVNGPLPLPVGVVGDPLISTADALRFPFTTPTVPATCASYLPAQGVFRFDEPADLPGLAPQDLVSARIVSFPGPRGEIEALALEPPRNRRRDLVVMAVHGGPVDQWSAGFNPELQLLARSGATVVAPNYHGSTGYGPDFVQALEGRAGTVDFDDLVAVAEATTWGSRWPLVAYGESYGAFLALQLATARPDLFQGVIAISPCASLASLRAVARPQVRQLVDLLTGPSGRDAVDLLHVDSTPRCPLLLAHGSEDHTIPVEQSRDLARALRIKGYVDGRDLWLLELSGEDHVLSGREARRELYRAIASFLSRITPTSHGVTHLASGDAQDTVWQVGGLAHAPEPMAPMTSS